MGMFDAVETARPPRNKFSLDHDVKMTLNMGLLYPMLMKEVLPGDHWRVNSTVFLRFLALIAPVMHRVNVSTHYFFVPNRLIWSNWQLYITGGDDGTGAPVVPNFKPSDVYAANPAMLRSGQLLDYLGFPVLRTAEVFNAAYNPNNFSMLPLRAYSLVYDQYYRDEWIEPSALPPGFLSDGNQVGINLTNCIQLRNRAWEKDYFTSCLPQTQKGADALITPGNIPINPQKVRNIATGNTILSQTGFTTDATGNWIANPSGFNAYLDGFVSTITVNALRASIFLQEFLEKNARGGTRYQEFIRHHFGVMSSDARLQRAEFLGGSVEPVTISEVLTTAPPAAGPTYPPATLAGHGISIGERNGFTRFFEEHGHILGILSVVPRTAYDRMMPPEFWRGGVNTQFYFPSFAHLGEQAVKNFEVYTNFSDAAAAGNFNSTFGYQSRYCEYKYANSRAAGQMRETFSFWTWHRQFVAQPALNLAFIQCVPRVDQFAIATDVDHMVCQVIHNIDVMRMMPYFSTPGIS